MKRGKIILGAIAFIAAAGATLASKAYIGQRLVYGPTKAGSICYTSTCFTNFPHQAC